MTQSEKTTPKRPTPPPLPTRTFVTRKKRPKQQRPLLKRTRHPRGRHSRQKIRKELSAGGVAVRQEGKEWLVALLMTEHKRGKVWVLPKGHVELDSNEGIADAARREVEEEAGLKDLSVKDQLGVTRFRFQVEDGVVYKTVHYFLMITNQIKLVPQAEEGLIDAGWFPIDEAIKKLEYDTDQDIVKRGRDRLIPPTKAPRRRNLRIHL